MTDLTPLELAALRDAHAAINHGGLSEVADGNRGTCWVGGHPDCAAEHRPYVITALRDLGLLERTGRPPLRSAQITEAGLMELDIAGVAA